MTRSAVLLCCLTTFAALSAQGQATQRAFRVDDLFELEGVGRYYGGPYAFSPDGRRLTVTRTRPEKTRTDLRWFLWGNGSSDVWVTVQPGDSLANITKGASDGSGWWSTQWSPDGNRLAMLSTRGGSVHLWVWDTRTRQLRQVSKTTLDLPRVRERPYIWLDDTHLMYPTLAPGELSQGLAWESRTPQLAAAGWAAFNRNSEPTASVLQSGVPADVEKRPHGTLVSVDIASGREQEIADARTSGWVVSPNGKAVAWTRTVTSYTPKASEPLPFGVAGLATLEVAMTNGQPVTLDGPVSRDVLEESLRWSNDGNTLAFLGYAAGRDVPPLLYVLDITKRTVTSRSLTGLDAAPIVREQPQLEWTASGEILINAASASESRDVRARRDWYLLAADGSQRVLTKQMPTPPRILIAQEGRRAFVGVAAGEVWRVTPAAGTVENLTESVQAPAETIAWPAQTNSGSDEYAYPSRAYSQVVFTVRDGTRQAPYILDLGSGNSRAITKPSVDADLVSYSPQSGSAVFSESNRNGLRVWRTNTREGTTSALVAANGFLRDVAEGEWQSIEYTSLDGAKLKAWVILPYGYEKGKRYPLLTWVYAGSVAAPRPSAYQSINSSGSLNLQIPAGRGYVVLIPSMPLSPEGVADDPMLRLPNGVLPAVDKLVELGIADPARLFLMGQSFGGFSTYGLITQTRRFTAAVSLAGLSNLISLYSQFDARLRYSDYPHENLFQAALFESAQVRMGSPPWRDLNRYIRNSPIFFVDRVETPLMIVQGDQDYVALQQGEEFFMSLYRQGKRASFVRYWGEGHVLASPANIKDMWSRIFAWFDEFSPR